ncbi:MAG: ribosome small subunit-dependent GTPase A [Lachnospiraceae bacterium]|nr:ribosome small subunit-dependent GTPase A [Lachnospiraceae bacterium]
MQGKIMKGIAGFYYVHTAHSGIYECKAKGIFRNKNQKPLIGDDVEIQIVDEEKKLGNIIEIKERTNELIRPAVANINQSLVVFAITSPEPNLNLLDRFLLMMEYLEIPVGICFQKCDLDAEKRAQELKQIYQAAGYPVFLVSAKEESGFESLQAFLKGKTTALAGPSGVGKSSMLNVLCAEELMQTGEISEKIGRGRHTTRHTELFPLDADTYLFDTPGFSSLAVWEIEAEQLRFYFPEFAEHEGTCKYQGCVHVSEPGCQVKAAVEAKQIKKCRYDSYVMFFKELYQRQKNQYK